MSQPQMTSMQRVLTTLGYHEPDRVPLFLLLTMHGAKELGISIKDYFSKAETVVKGQLRLHEKYQNDCLYTFFYASLEVEAFGGETIFIDDGPPNAGEPIIKKAEEILSLSAPIVKHTLCLQKVLKAQSQLKSKVGNEAPIIGVVMSPSSMPIIQMGFEPYLNLMYERPDLLQKLLDINISFCVDWANAQLAAGATAICYFDPFSSSTVISREQYLQWGFPTARQTISQINGPTATHFASGRCLPLIDDIAQTGTAIIGVSTDENLRELKTVANSRLTLLGNLNGIEMCRWTAAQVEEHVKHTISAGGPGGGFILSDNHGEIPFQVSEDVLMEIGNATRKWGTYPLHWTTENV